MLRVVVLISGQGSNLRAFLDSCAEGTIPAKVVAVGADSDVSGLDHARHFGIPTFVQPLEPGGDRDAWGTRLGDRIAEFTPDLVILSGFRRLVPPAFVRRFAPMLLNTHPAYLPEFPGAHAVRDAFEAGVTETGATVIVVDDGVDTGPILAQRRVPLIDGDTESTLHDRIKIVERELLADVVRDLANRETAIEEN
ncbi:MAG: phosphoribosylglycinamide formyltransferase [Actinobacteria bacterium]|uniref:phosphoribosylglycinamide formyltransferase 1 n=1 Tax=freshwater metagenome TaxID=449393 RepID=A0A6J6XIK5_9ZZZZ|nr:phosphoribosylglycinamide formyltransferase [Actinomycetota bacterium]